MILIEPSTPLSKTEALVEKDGGEKDQDKWKGKCKEDKYKKKKEQEEKNNARGFNKRKNIIIVGSKSIRWKYWKRMTYLEKGQEPIRDDISNGLSSSGIIITKTFHDEKVIVYYSVTRIMSSSEDWYINLGASYPWIEIYFLNMNMKKM